jgi:hypothetical protein
MFHRSRQSGYGHDPGGRMTPADIERVSSVTRKEAQMRVMVLGGYAVNDSRVHVR